MQLTLFIIDRKTWKRKNIYYTSEYNIIKDAISPNNSEFLLLEDVPDTDISGGDIIIVQPDRTTLDIVRYWDNSGETVYSGLYFGIVDSFKDNLLMTRDILDIFNQSVTLRGSLVSETNPSLYIQKMFYDYIKPIQGLFLENIDLHIKTENQVTDWKLIYDVYPPTTINLLGLLSDIFVKTQTICECKGFTMVDSEDSGTVINLHFVLDRKVPGYNNEQALFINTDNYAIFKNTETYFQEVNYDNPNSISFEDPDGDVYQFFLHEDGTVDQTLDDTVRQPVSHVFEFYEGGEDLVDVAKETLVKQDYNHEINIDIVTDMSSLKYFDLGAMCDIRYKKKNYESIISSYRISSSGSMLGLGNFKMDLKMILDGSEDDETQNTQNIKHTITRVVGETFEAEPIYGNGGSISWWRSLEPGYYWNSNNSITGLPSVFGNYGMLEVIRIGDGKTPNDMYFTYSRAGATTRKIYHGWINHQSTELVWQKISSGDNILQYDDKLVDLTSYFTNGLSFEETTFYASFKYDEDNFIYVYIRAYRTGSVAVGNIWNLTTNLPDKYKPTGTRNIGVMTAETGDTSTGIGRVQVSTSGTISVKFNIALASAVVNDKKLVTLVGRYHISSL